MSLDQAIAKEVSARKRARNAQHHDPRPSYKPPSTARRGYFPDGSGVPFADDALGHAGDVMSKANEILAAVSDLTKAAPAVSREAAQAVRKLDFALEKVTARRDHFAGQMVEATTTKTEFDAETRAHVKSSADPFSTAREMLRSNDYAVMAVVRAPAAISGLTREQHELIKREAQRQLAPEAVANREIHEKAITALTLTKTELQQQTKRIMDAIDQSDDAKIAATFKEPANDDQS